MTLRELLSGKARIDGGTFVPSLFDPQNDTDRAQLETLLQSNEVRVVDAILTQLDELVRGRAPSENLSPEAVDERIRAVLAGVPAERFGCWVYYPWKQLLVHVLPRSLHREVRLDRNRHKISREEQDRLLSLRIGIAGLSVGRSILTTLAREGVGGRFRLADFDTMSLSNLNRAEGGLADLGIHKAVLAARQIVELDPYFEVEVDLDGVVPATLDRFIAGLDIVIDECDDLAMKVALRERARAARLPVVMATSDRGMLDVERFDLEPERPLFHGLLEGIRGDELVGLTTKQKIPYVLRVLEARRLEGRIAASLIEIKETVSTWPQLASDVVLGGAMVTNTIRRIALGELRCSGRFEIDLDERLTAKHAIEPKPERPFAADPPAAVPGRRGPERPPAGTGAPTPDELRFIVACATLAPSGGNTQPWRFSAGAHGITCAIAARPSFLDFEHRASAVAAGAALENAVIAARALGFRADVTLGSGDDRAWSVRLERTGRPIEDDRELELVRTRCTNRELGPATAIGEDALRAITAAAGSLVVRAVSGADELARFAETIAAAERLQMLSEKTHREIFAEMRFTRAEALAKRDGLDVASLGLDATEIAIFDVLRSQSAMDALRELGLGRPLGGPARTAFQRAGAAIVVACSATDRRSLVQAGRDLERMWLTATASRVAVYPWGTPFLLQRLRDARETFEPWEQEALDAVAKRFAEQLRFSPSDAPLLVLKLTNAGPPAACSLRRELDAVLELS